jgi:hypothetical protein
MSSATFIRRCGLAAVLGGVVYASQGFLVLIAAHFLASPSDELGVSQVPRYLEDVFLFLLLLGVMAAIAGLHTLQRERYGWLGALCSLTALVGTVLLLAGAVLETLAGPAFEASLWFLIPGLLVATVGLVSLGSVTMSARVLSRWVGALVILGSPLSYFLLIFALAVLLPFETMLSPLLVGVAWALVGYALLRQVRDDRPHNPRV